MGQFTNTFSRSLKNYYTCYASLMVGGRYAQKRYKICFLTEVMDISKVLSISTDPK